MELKIKSQRKNKHIVLFVHGFIGGEKTWVREDGEKSLMDSLLEDESISSRFDIGYVNYFTQALDFFSKGSLLTNIIFRKQRTSNLPVKDISSMLEDIIRVQCATYQSVILVAHSMGGLISKSCILEDLKKTGANSKIKLFISLAVPHLGSDLATLGRLVSGNPQVENLKPLGSIVKSLNEEWVQSKQTPQTLYFIGLNDTVVIPTAAVPILAQPSEIIRSTDDHFSILVVKDSNEIVRSGLKKALHEYSPEAPAPASQPAVAKDLGGSSPPADFVPHSVIQTASANNKNITLENGLHLSNIRKLLKQGLSDGELTDFTQDYFFEVYNNFAEGQLKSAKIRLLLDFVIRRDQGSFLLERLKTNYPGPYSEYGPYE